VKTKTSHEAAKPPGHEESKKIQTQPSFLRPCVFVPLCEKKNLTLSRQDTKKARKMNEIVIASEAKQSLAQGFCL
jgi:hypothetical protein